MEPQATTATPSPLSPAETAEHALDIALRFILAELSEKKAAKVVAMTRARVVEAEQVVKVAYLRSIGAGVVQPIRPPDATQLRRPRRQSSPGNAFAHPARVKRLRTRGHTGTVSSRGGPFSLSL